MRDPARIDPMLRKLRTAWKLNPDLRLGQLVNWVAKLNGGIPHLLEDDVMETNLDRYLSDHSAVDRLAQMEDDGGEVFLDR